MSAASRWSKCAKLCCAEGEVFDAAKRKMIDPSSKLHKTSPLRRANVSPIRRKKTKLNKRRVVRRSHFRRKHTPAKAWIKGQVIGVALLGVCSQHQLLYHCWEIASSRLTRG